MVATKHFTVHSSISDLADRYDGFILDQFGVMHDGVTALKGASSCVQALRALGKKVVILSNSSSVGSVTVERLPSLGFDADNFVGAVTSGEEAAQHIQDEFQGQTALFWTWKTGNVSSPYNFLEHCGNVKATNKVEQADFILLHGCEVLRGPGRDGEAEEISLGDYVDSGKMKQIRPILEQCLKRKLPMLCVNPDFIYVKSNGQVHHMPGKIAQLYEDMGGQVTSFGKPHRRHFQACIRKLNLPKERVVHVGDSLFHDVKGANESGLNSIFISSGVHRTELGVKFGQVPEMSDLKELFADHGHTPSHVVPALQF